MYVSDYILKSNWLALTVLETENCGVNCDNRDEIIAVAAADGWQKRTVQRAGRLLCTCCCCCCCALVVHCLKCITVVVRCTSAKRKWKLWDVSYYYTRNFVQSSQVVCSCTSKLTGSELGGTILNSASCKGEGCLTQVRQETEENWSRFWYCHNNMNHKEVTIIMRGYFENLIRKYQVQHMFLGKE